ncbi:AprI/Inh family metalloprotease inhibitor [Microvirga tunisiensis]|uniref:AprI/Inh family metalloprotease inhibitor n=2 Tax=Pannonibacter tanglangensis TaxID=2750084 RepID=A0A7X5F647_9HYPH|nr:MULTISPECIES: protease inhibitor Inh/omp19 family protein [unclassified Pannonibacter]NBN65016.1 AprI/Inh family metalloprotease inhibitor [Pannonibacter sp. XCT-34]NBN79525.1 AprI/Inh family metalloprotease inhibitor [Pannonibacter sp. XCT-53]
MKRVATIAVVLCLTGVAGCQRFGGGQYSAPPLPATPTTPVSGGQLTPLTVPAPGAVSAEPMAPQPGLPAATPAPGQQVAALPAAPAPATAREIGRNDMLGGWKIASGSSNCMLFMTLTTWTGGYRANTRGCNDATLSSVSAWDLSGKQVVLKDNSGGEVARLYAGAGESFSGQTSAGSAVTLSR